MSLSTRAAAADLGEVVGTAGDRQDARDQDVSERVLVGALATRAGDFVKGVAQCLLGDPSRTAPSQGLK